MTTSFVIGSLFFLFVLCRFRWEISSLSDRVATLEKPSDVVDDTPIDVPHLGKIGDDVSAPDHTLPSS